MNNIKLSHMSHWKNIPYKHIKNFREFYYEDNTNVAYYADYDKILKYHAALGYDGLELAPWDMAGLMDVFGTPQDFLDFIHERGGLEVSGMFFGSSFTHVKENLARCVDALKEAVGLVASFGGKHINMCPTNNYYGIGPLSREEVKNTAMCFNEMGRVATEKGIMIGIHNEFFCAINKDNHREFIELTDPRYVHYCLDTAQIEIIGEDMVKFYNDYHDRICTLHLKDTAAPKQPDAVRYAKDPEIDDDGKRWFWEPGMGVLDFEALWNAMKVHGFKGWVTVETDGTPDLLASMALSSYYIKNELYPIYH